VAFLLKAEGRRQRAEGGRREKVVICKNFKRFTLILWLFQTNYDKLLAKIPIKQNPSSKIIKII